MTSEELKYSTWVTWTRFGGLDSSSTPLISLYWNIISQNRPQNFVFSAPQKNEIDSGLVNSELSLLGDPFNIITMY